MDGPTRAGLLGEAADTALALLAARTRIRTWVATTSADLVVAVTGPRAPDLGVRWAPAPDAFSLPLSVVGGQSLGRLTAIGGTVVDVELVRLVATTLGALLQAGPASTEDRPSDDPAAALEDLLDFAREQLGMDLAFVGEFRRSPTGGEQVVRAVSRAGSLLVAVGAVTDLARTLCQRVMDGRLPRAAADTADLPAAEEVPAVVSLPIRSYVTVPLTLPDGTLYGTLCCLSPRVHPSFGKDSIAALEVVAQAVVQVLVPDRVGSFQSRRAALEVGIMLAAGGPSTVYQPAVRLAGIKAGFVEALSRFADGRPPDQWFREATAVGLGVELEVTAAQRGLEAVAVGRDVSVNLSAATITSGALSELLAELPLEQVVVEVSEHEAVSDYLELGRALAPYRAAGLRLAVDDAGAGYASLRHVVRLAPDVIKLDMSLVSGIDSDSSRRELAGALTSFAHRTGAVVVAEGVERLAEHEVLRDVGVDLGQGFLYAVPAPL